MEFSPLRLKKRVSLGRPRGMALVLVLAALVLASVLIIGFFTAVQQERVSSGLYESGTSTHQLVDTAAGVVMAQISAATENPDLAWISQPGLLRTFDNNGAVAAYKIYSSDNMKVNGAFDPIKALDSEVPNDWESKTNEFVDLNRPVTVTKSTGTGMTNTVNYPIVDFDLADNNDNQKPEGFSLEALPKTSEASPLPMPVRWIYVLKDGTLASYATAVQRSEDAVGRIAFWADDETCKVNLNVAADGVYYDAPAIRSAEDHKLAVNQPIAQEYQRYPGHPATTSLAAVLPVFRTTYTNLVQRSLIAASLVPRIGWGGSEGGEKPAWLQRLVGKVDADRLLASADEAQFGRAPNNLWNAANGQRVKSILPTIKEEIEKYPFFLTTESRAPELNLFNRPRITLWPFNTELLQNAAGLTPEDRLIKFASELGSNKRKLYFQRQNAWDPFEDYDKIDENQDLYGYLQWLTSQPFPAGNTSRASSTFEGKYGELGRDQIITQMFDYLRSNVNTLNQSYQPVQGPTYSFPQGHTSKVSGFNDITPLVVRNDSTVTKGLGNGSPVLNELILQFYASESTLDEGTLGLRRAAQYVEDGNTEEAFDPVKNPEKLTPDDYIVRKVRLVVLLDFTTVVNNLSTAMPRFQVRLGSSSQFFIGPNENTQTDKPTKVRKEGGDWMETLVPMGFPGDTVNVYCSNVAQFDGDDTDTRGGPLGISYGLVYPRDGNIRTEFANDKVTWLPKTLERKAGYQYYPFFSDVVEFRIPVKTQMVDGEKKVVRDTYTDKPLPAYEPTAAFAAGDQGGKVTMNVKIYPALTKEGQSLTALDPATSKYWQWIQLEIDPGAIPLPLVGPEKTDNGADYFVNDRSWTGGYPTYAALADYDKRLKFGNHDILLGIPWNPETAASETGNTLNRPMDALRGYYLDPLKASGGDFRVVAAQREILDGGNWYSPHPIYLGFDAHTRFHGVMKIGDRQAQTPELIKIRDGLETADLTDIKRFSGALLPNLEFGGSQRVAPRPLNGAYRKASVIGDFTQGYGSRADGALVQGPDVGAVSRNYTSDDPYYTEQITRAGENDSGMSEGNNTAHSINFAGLLFSPWKQMPSPVMFGTLPARALSIPPSAWDTLLFNPVPSGGKTQHLGWMQLPRDHYWLDLFYMPVVEPYAITENLATNGKINLNQQIAPFTYIKRYTGFYALLRNEKILALPSSISKDYKTIEGASQRGDNIPASMKNKIFRKAVNVAETVLQIEDRFQNNDPFVSASEICEIPIVPDGERAATVEAFWKGTQAALTGDDKREMPYNHLYPRLTTRSNTFKIFYWVQSLKGTKGTPGRWIVTSQRRGSQTIERFLNLGLEVYGKGSAPRDKFPALAGIDPETLQPYYRFRTVENRQFSPQ